MYITFQASIVPLFLIFLDAVHQLIEQFPSVFGMWLIIRGIYCAFQSFPPSPRNHFFPNNLILKKMSFYTI